MGRTAVSSECSLLRRAIVGAQSLAVMLRNEGVEIISAPVVEPRDAVFAAGHHLIVGSLRAVTRRPEIEIFRSLAATSDIVPPGSHNEVDGAFLEGGDVILNGDQAYVGMSGNASNLAGIDWLAAKLGPAWRVVPMALRSSVRHLEDVLALVRPGLLIQNPTLLVDGLPRALRDWRSIDIGDGESANVLVLGENRVVVQQSQARLIAMLRAEGVEVSTLPLGGGLRSAHAALLRE